MSINKSELEQERNTKTTLYLIQILAELRDQLVLMNIALDKIELNTRT